MVMHIQRKYVQSLEALPKNMTPDWVLKNVNKNLAWWRNKVFHARVTSGNFSEILKNK